MGHISYTQNKRPKATPPEWLAVGADVGFLTRDWAGRADIAAYIGDSAGQGAPACFDPRSAEVEVNRDIAFGESTTPEMVGNLKDRDTQFAWPRVTGLIFHEAMHARFSTWDIQRAHETLTPAEFTALVLLEEGRIESRGLKLYPDNACFLRSCVLDLVMRDAQLDGVPVTDTHAAAHIAALTSARVDAGSVNHDDIEAVENLVMDKLGLTVFLQLSSIWREAQDTPESDIEKLYELARRWAAIVADTAEANGEPRDPGQPGQPGDGSGLGEFIKDLLEEVREAAEAASVGAQDDVNDQQTTEEWRDEVNSRAQAAGQEREHKKTSESIFSKGTGPVACRETASRLMNTRQPAAEERRAAVKLALALEKAKYRERDAHDVASIIPPGRLRTRAVVQGAALKSKGVHAPIEPWRRTVRKHTDDPTLSIGVMVDISGSMSYAMEPMAVTAWVLSEAARRVQGRAAMVYYGTGVFATLKPGQHLREVTVYSAPDGTERFDTAFKALNGALDVLHGRGARMLVVVSDGCYTNAETIAAKLWLRECDRAGVAVTWVDFDANCTISKDVVSGTKAQLIVGSTNPTDTASAIGKAAVKALAAATAGV